MTPAAILAQISVPIQLTIKQALRKMDEGGKRILLVVNDGILEGVITDGDIRRWILANGDLSAEVDKIVNRSPITIQEDSFSIDEAKRIMTERGIECVPIVDKNRHLSSIVFWIDVFENRTPAFGHVEIPVVIMAGGQGTRLHPYTKILPKPLIPVGEKPIVEHIIDRFFSYGCKEFLLSVNFKAAMIRAYFAENDGAYKIDYVEEKTPLGTAGSLALLPPMAAERFFVTNCDILVTADYSDIHEFHVREKNLITVVASLKHFKVPYGVMEIDGKELRGMKEKPEFDFFINTGMYLMERSVLQRICRDEFCDMTTLIARCLEDKQRVGVYPVSEKSWLDMGQLEELDGMLTALGVKRS